jgi:hydrogenase maturation protein HypF
LVGDYRGYRRAAHLAYLPLPGGDVATRKPWRIACGYLYALLGDVPAIAIPKGVTATQIDLLGQQIDRKINCPQTSSMGRLFDAVAALLGICTETSYEAQAAIELEMAASRSRLGQTRIEPPAPGSPAYPFQVEAAGELWQVRTKPLFAALLDDMDNQLPVAEAAWRFHHTIARMIVQVCERIAAQTQLRTVALSGGCFQNRLLLALTLPALENAGFQVLLHSQVPCNDGGLSLGQAAVAHYAYDRRNGQNKKDEKHVFSDTDVNQIYRWLHGAGRARRRRTRDQPGADA